MVNGALRVNTDAILGTLIDLPANRTPSYKYPVFFFFFVVFFFSICLLRFVLTTQFYRDLENSFQSIMYND